MFTANQFTATQWDSADDKAKFAKQFIKFVNSNFEQRHFTDRFYRRLSNTFSHIAHYNRLGFWETFFTTTADKVQFLKLTLKHPCYGDPAWTYSDVERAIQGWLKQEETLAKWQLQLKQEKEASERAEFERLKAKFK